jgi:hypothetical protein
MGTRKSTRPKEPRTQIEASNEALDAVVRKEDAKRKLEEWKRKNPNADPGGLLDAAVDAEESTKARQKAKHFGTGR